MWVSDITYVLTREGWLYLVVVLALLSRRVVGWSTSSTMTRQLLIDALQIALGRRMVSRGLVLHSNRGSQYASTEYQLLLKRHGFRCGMSEKGNCYDNAVAESLFHSLKTELIRFSERCSRRAV